MKMMLWAAAILAEAVLLATAAVADPKKSAAVGKVVTMLEDMYKKVDDELYQESTTFWKFETFCNETKEEKTTSISDLTDKREELEATIQAKTARTKELGVEIADLDTDLDDVKQAIEELDAARKTEKEDYQTEKEDLSTAIKALNGAVDALAGDKALSFLQLPEGVQKAAALANFLGLKSNAADTLLAQQEQASSQQSSTHLSADFELSSGLKETLETMLEEMRDARNTADLDEMKAQSAYRLTRQSKEQLAAQHRRDKATAEADKAAASKAKATGQKRLDMTLTSLADDEAYLAELTQMCADKKAAWDLRSTSRKGELEALQQATDIMKEGMAEETKEADAAMVQLSSHRSALEDAEAAAEAAEAKAAEAPAAPTKTLRAGFLQLRSDSEQRKQPPSARQQLVAMLRKESVELRSPALLAVARSAEDPADPLTKVKAMVSGLVKDMEEKAGEASTQKEFCDTNVAEQEEKRDTASAQVSKLNRDLAFGEATRDQLAEEIETLTKQLKELSDAKTEAETLRADEAAEAKNTVEEAEEGLAAVGSAISVLETFYNEVKETQTKSTAKLPTAQNATGAAEDAPDVGFDDSKAYVGGGESNTVLGLLEVIKSDFNRTIEDSNAEESKAEAEHEDFLKDNAGATSEKETAKGEKQTEKVTTEDQISTDETSLDNQVTLLKGSLNQLADLAKTCSAVGNSEMRIAKRAEEMKALEGAIEYLTKLIDQGAA